MKRVRLIHWNTVEAEQRLEALAAAGFDAVWEPFGPPVLRALGSDPPAAIVIDLTRSPAQGRDLGVFLRKTKATREVPLVFAGGDPAKIERIVTLLPDATYTSWRGIAGGIKRALRPRGNKRVVPSSTFAAYVGTPLLKKLGVKAGMVVALVGAPDGFEKTLGKLPEGASIRRGARGNCDLAIWFARSHAEVARRIVKLGASVGRGGLWIAWPKKASGVPSDLSQAVVRRTGLDSGLVDYKVCSIDDTWSGLRFTRRKKD